MQVVRGVLEVCQAIRGLDSEGEGLGGTVIPVDVVGIEVGKRAEEDFFLAFALGKIETVFTEDQPPLAPLSPLRFPFNVAAVHR